MRLVVLAIVIAACHSAPQRAADVLATGPAPRMPEVDGLDFRDIGNGEERAKLPDGDLIEGGLPLIGADEELVQRVYPGFHADGEILKLRLPPLELALDDHETRIALFTTDAVVHAIAFDVPYPDPDAKRDALERLQRDFGPARGDPDEHELRLDGRRHALVTDLDDAWSVIVSAGRR